jgi:hypothetical protein
MADETTILPAPKFVPQSVAAKSFRDIYKKVASEVRGGMTMPSDPHDRLIALNTINNVLDRLEEAIDRHVAESER